MADESWKVDYKQLLWRISCINENTDEDEFKSILRPAIGALESEQCFKILVCFLWSGLYGH